MHPKMSKLSNTRIEWARDIEVNDECVSEVYIIDAEVDPGEPAYIKQRWDESTPASGAEISIIDVYRVEDDTKFIRIDLDLAFDDNEVESIKQCLLEEFTDSQDGDLDDDPDYSYFDNVGSNSFYDNLNDQYEDPMELFDSYENDY